MSAKSTYKHLYKNLNYSSPEEMEEVLGWQTWIKDFIPGPLFTPDFAWSEVYRDGKITKKKIKEELAKIPDFESFYDAWWFLQDHPAFMDRDGSDLFEHNLYLFVAKVNPRTHRIEEDKTKNTKVEVWLEHGHWVDMPEDGCQPAFAGPSHDNRLDCGAPTFEKAILKLAKLVKLWYGDSVETTYTGQQPHGKPS